MVPGALPEGLLTSNITRSLRPIRPSIRRAFDAGFDLHEDYSTKSQPDRIGLLVRLVRPDLTASMTNEERSIGAVLE